MKRILLHALTLVAGLGAISSCTDDGGLNFPLPTVPQATLTPVATNPNLWTGVAVTREGRIFANFPRMDTDTIPYSVAEVNGSQATPFPNAEWNTWNRSLSPQDRFVSVQSVYTDDQNFLWVLDPASPQMRGVVQGGAKLLKFDVNTRQLVQRIGFEEPIIFPTSYLNDVRVDTQRQVAYITDSGRGAIIVVDLKTGRSRRLLGNDPSTKSENLPVVVEGRVWRDRTGALPSIDSDGLALTPQRDYVYYHALTATGLYRIATAALLDESLSSAQLAQRVELVQRTEPVDGMLFDARGNLYLTYIQQNAVTRLTPSGQLQRIAQDDLLKWPDSFASGPNGALYVTSSQLHIPRSQRTEPFRIFRFTPAQ